MAKATIQLSVRWIVIIIILLALLFLLLSFIQRTMRISMASIEEKIVEGAPKPVVEITAPENMAIFEVGEEVNFESYAYSYSENVKITDYYWDYNTDGYVDSRLKDPTTIYYEPGDYNVTLKVLSSIGGLGTDSIIVRVFTKNKKKMNKYDGNPAFFIPVVPSTDSSLNVENWKEIIQVIPLTRWNDKYGDHSYEYVAIAKGEGRGEITKSDVGDKLSSMGKTHGVTFDMGTITPDGYTVSNEYTSDLANYFSYWEEYDSVVVVDEDNAAGALIAGLFAAYYNSPIVFIDSRLMGASYEDYEINGKRIYVIDNIPSSAFDYFITKGNALSWQPYSSDELRDPSRKINRIVELKSNLTIKG
ncbi:MAG TPA: PKD domain-containing protein [Candidatus Nanoarchaeia archaeon]|nr:PKD domain-containing protein [Candidatus Nanoarchaeia archaeon]